MKFERLTVIKRVENKYTSGGYPKVVWKCVCDCGNELNVPSGNLLNGSTKSCGCYSRDMASERVSKRNKKQITYDLSGEYGIGYTTKGEEFYFDLEDYDLIKDRCWFKHHSGYFMSQSKKVKLYLHKLIMDDLNNDYLIDHKDGDKSNNRKSNLRIGNYSLNNINRDVTSINTSGRVGVQWHKRDMIWESWISVNHKRVYLGRFNKFEDAVKVRKDAEDKYYGEWSYDNSRS